ncbi:MAG TPA: GGDEF domain-containing protein [Vicinamibacterales bacterium]|jgi:diguanylate cyclase (GGDEF)-like protein|nr:GGDEF domain-containing protein [Vicinamibacterales bacterium]
MLHRVLQLARRQGIPWRDFASAGLFVSFVSLCQAAVFSGAWPQVALTSRITLALYLIAIFAASLRSDPRVVTFTGLLASAEWVTLLRIFPDVRIERIGMSVELLVIAVATMLAWTIASRARSLGLSSIRDDLTGLLNRGHLEQRLATELMRSSRNRRPVALAIVDVDQLQRVNDSAGRGAGDEVLREIAVRLTKTMRRSDLCARIGGDEFALAFVDTSVADAAVKVEEIRRTVSATPISLRVRAVVTITCSAGVAVAPLDGEDAKTLLRIANARLFAAKHAGRDCLMIAG